MINHSYTSPVVEDGTYKIFTKDNLYSLTEKEYIQHVEMSDFVQWGRANPAFFIEEVLGAGLLDYQTYILENVWTASQSVVAMSRNAGKSTMIALICMSRCLLFPNTHIYIASSTGGQSIETFNKIVQLTKRAIPSFRSLTDCFANEVVKSQSRTDGFVRDPSSHHFELYNGSDVHTVNSNVDAMRGKRANIVIFDEAGVIDDSVFGVLEPYAAQNTSFQLSTDYDEVNIMVEPRPMPNQLMYFSSASSMDSYFYQKFKEASIKSWAGDNRYFCADINAEAIINATKGGKTLPEPLLTREHVESAMQRDKESAMREYMNVFQLEGGDQQIIKRSEIIRNSYPYAPELFNVDNSSMYVLAWDPSRRSDGSTVSVGKFWKDPTVGWKMRIVNCITLVDVFSKQKYMMSAPNQVEEVKKILVRYNGEGVADYENILGFYVDSGSGGAGVNMTDYLCADFDIGGITHRGLIDPEYNEGDERKFPNAVKNKLKLISPTKYRSQMFEEAIQMVNQNVVEFPEDYNTRGYITLIYEVDKDGNKKQRYTFPTEKEEKALKRAGISVEITKHNLDREEEMALTQIDMMKREIVNMWRFKTSSGNDRFELAPDKISSMHDDRNYTFILLCHFLSDLRRENITKRKKQTNSSELAQKFSIRKARYDKAIG